MTLKMKQRIVMLLPLIAFIISISFVIALGGYLYRQSAFYSISGFCEHLIEDNPALEAQILSTLKEYQTDAKGNITNPFLKRYGYTSSDFAGEIQQNFWICAGVVFVITSCTYFISGWYRNKWNRMRISYLTKYLEQINLGATGTVLQTEEDAFSHLQDEIYKTVTTLYHTRDAALKAKKNFADNLANIAHQLKTPITAASLSLQMLSQEVSTVYAKQIGKQLERLDRLEGALLTLSKIDAGTLQLEQSPVDIFTALTLAAENINDLLIEKNVSVSIPDKGCVEILGDMEWTMEAFLNLMKNCMEHSPSGGTVHCDYSSNPLYAEILIWDEGKGFEQDELPYIFERFYRGKRTVGNGAGIGLALAKSIFELQKGNITARNLPEGGACFEIRVYSH